MPRFEHVGGVNVVCDMGLKIGLLPHSGVNTVACVQPLLGEVLPEGFGRDLVLVSEPCNCVDGMAHRLGMQELLQIDPELLHQLGLGAVRVDPSFHRSTPSGSPLSSMIDHSFQML